MVSEVKRSSVLHLLLPPEPPEAGSRQLLYLAAPELSGLF